MNLQQLLYNRLSEDELVKSSINSKDLKNFVLIIEKFLNSDKLSEDACYKIYKELKLPYSIVYRAFGLISEILDDGRLKEKLSILVNLSAKLYIKREISTLKKMLVHKKNHDFLLFKANEEWIEEIIFSVKNDKMEKFPLVDENNCLFKTYLSYLESLMVCLDEKLCVYITELHKLLHTLANSFYTFYTKTYYPEAYFVFKDLKEQVLKFYNSLSELYITAYSNVERSFFELINILIKSKTVYIAVIDLKSLKQMNVLYNENLITYAKVAIYEALYENYHYKKNYLFINGSSNDYYFLAVDIDYGEFEKEIRHIYEEITKEVDIDGEKLYFDALVLGIQLNRYSQIQVKDIINYFYFLKKKAKKEDKNILLNNKNNHLEDWVKNQLDFNFIRKKIETKSVDVVFQPVFESVSGKIFSLEALGRIVDEGNLISAGMFIDHIYEMDKIAEFDAAILDKILEKKDLIKQIANRIFINISFAALNKPDYIEKLLEILKTVDVDIILELTEQRFVENLEIIEKINKNTNSFFAVDDFGSGYSSIILVINLLKKNMIRVLKIDGSLVKDIKNDEYLKKAIKIIVGFRKEFGLHLVAEFIEDEDTLDFIKDSGVNLMQGYYLSMPKTIEELLIEKREKIREIIE